MIAAANGPPITAPACYLGGATNVRRAAPINMRDAVTQVIKSPDAR
jgi:hypothetical protein